MTTADEPTGEPSADGADAVGQEASEPRHPDVRARPHRLSVLAIIAAVAVVVVCTVVGALLHGKTAEGGSFQRGDQVSMVVLGLLLAGGILLLTRPRLVADEQAVHVRNVFRTYDLPWPLVHRVRFSDGSPWAVLDLADDETVPVLALQAADGERTVHAVRGLRRMLAAQQQR